jgi:hypothetical protein
MRKETKTQDFSNTYSRLAHRQAVARQADGHVRRQAVTGQAGGHAHRRQAVAGQAGGHAHRQAVAGQAGGLKQCHCASVGDLAF